VLPEDDERNPLSKKGSDPLNSRGLTPFLTKALTHGRAWRGGRAYAFPHAMVTLGVGKVKDLHVSVRLLDDRLLGCHHPTNEVPDNAL
jgi:hypothetical protein